MKRPTTFVVPVADQLTYNRCFRSSPPFRTIWPCEVFSLHRCGSAAKAFNKAIDKAHHELLVFCHQDILLPASWADTLKQRLDELEALDPHWGVTGCAGITEKEEVAAHLYRHEREFRGSLRLPARVRTLDESIIVFRHSTGLRFDERLPGFFRYGVDICLQSEARGLFNYAIDVPCFHQAKDRSVLPTAFFREDEFLIAKWRERLPIQTLSGKLTGSFDLTYRRVRNRWNRLARMLGWQKRPWWSELPHITVQDALR